MNACPGAIVQYDPPCPRDCDEVHGWFIGRIGIVSTSAKGTCRVVFSDGTIKCHDICLQILAGGNVNHVVATTDED